MELKEKIDLVLSFEKSKARWRNKFDSPERITTSALHHSLFGEHLSKSKNCGCVDDFFSYLNSLKNNTESINQKQNQMESQFLLKKGKAIVLHGMNDMVTKDNLTDAKALAILKKYPAHISSFEKYPENWKELTGGDKNDADNDEYPFNTDLTTDVDKAVLEKLNEKNVADLKKDLEPYPKEEWKDLKKKAEIVNYLFSKIKAEN